MRDAERMALGDAEIMAVPLEPDHPMVCILEAFKGEAVLALQSAEAGPQLWSGS